MKPSRYFTPSTLAISSAESRLVSGIGMTTSMSWSGRSRRIFSPRVTPMRMRALCTEISSIIESGRAKYTYSKMQGALACSGAHCWANSSPRAVTTMPSPGRTSRTRSKPRMSSATDSEATMYSSPPAAARLPSTSGRIPLGSRNATSPRPSTAQTTAYPPLARCATPAMARNAASGVSAFCRSSSCANTLSRTSESDSVLTLRRSCSNTSRRSASVFTRLPLCASAMPNGEFT